MKPLNGEKTHPLTAKALEELRGLAITERPCSLINPGIVNRLLRESLAETIMLRSPFPSHAPNHYIQHLRITDAGRAAANGDGKHV